MIVGVFLDRFLIDIFGFLFEIFRGNKYILIVIDYFLNWVEIIFILDLIVVIIVRVLLNEVIGRYGCLDIIFLD